MPGSSARSTWTGMRPSWHRMPRRRQWAVFGSATAVAWPRPAVLRRVHRRIRRSSKGFSVTDRSDPDVPRMKPDLPQFSGITPTDALATAAGAEGPASTRKRIVLAWGLWDWGSAAFNAVV